MLFKYLLIDTYWAAFAGKDIANPPWWPEGEVVPGLW